MNTAFSEGTSDGDVVTLRSPGQALTLKQQENIVREGWPSAFRSASERVWLRLGVEIDRRLQELPPHKFVSKISYSWSEVERFSTHAVWEAIAVIDIVDKANSADLPLPQIQHPPGMVE